MAKAIIRNGALVSNPLEGGDLNKLSPDMKQKTLDVLKKSEDGTRLSLDDLNTVMKARATVGATSDPTQSISASLRKLKEVLS